MADNSMYADWNDAMEEEERQRAKADQADQPPEVEDERDEATKAAARAIGRYIDARMSARSTTHALSLADVAIQAAIEEAPESLMEEIVKYHDGWQYQPAPVRESRLRAEIAKLRENVLRAAGHEECATNEFYADPVNREAGLPNTEPWSDEVNRLNEKAIRRIEADRARGEEDTRTVDQLIDEVFHLQQQLEPNTDPGDMTIQIQDDMPMVEVGQVGFKSKSKSYATGTTVKSALLNLFHDVERQLADYYQEHKDDPGEWLDGDEEELHKHLSWAESQLRDWSEMLFEVYLSYVPHTAQVATRIEDALGLLHGYAERRETKSPSLSDAQEESSRRKLEEGI